MPYTKPKVNIHHTVLFLAQQAGLSVDFICEQIGLSKEFLLEKSETMNTNQIILFWNMVNNHLPYDRPGLEFTKHIKLTYVGLMGELFSKLDTLAPLIPITCSVRNIITEMVHFDYTETDEYLQLNINTQGLWKEIDLESSLSASEYTLSNFFQILNQLADKPVTPHKVGIIPSKKSKRDYYADYFKTDVEFGDAFYIIYKKTDLAQEISTQNRRLHQHYLDLCKAQQFEETQGNSLTSHIENLVFYNYWPNIPSCEEMASYLFISYKQLQRLLKKEDVNYRQLVNTIKDKYASQMMRSGKFKATEISDILNYSHISAFSRAFKEHNGYTLNDFKKAEFLN